MKPTSPRRRLGVRGPRAARTSQAPRGPRGAAALLTVALGATLPVALVPTVLLPGTAHATPSPHDARAAVPQGRAAGTAAKDQGRGRLLLMLDASGSMKDADASGTTKMVAAKAAMSEVIDALPNDQQIGLRVYGATVASAGKATKAACADTQLTVPIGPLDKAALKRTVAGFTPLGETPIAYSLQQALGDLGTSGPRHIILVSDGEESCSPDPCPTIKTLVGNGVDLKIDTVGMVVGPAARRQLQCIAEAGGGRYYDTGTTAELSSTVGGLATGTVRPWTPGGTKVDGATETTNAPLLKPGVYQDALPANGTPQQYRITRDPSGSTYFSVTSRPPTHQTASFEKYRITMSLPDGRECGYDEAFGPPYTGVPSLLTASYALDAVKAGRPSGSVDADCRASTELVAAVARTPVAGGADLPVELTVTHEAAVPVTDNLPAPLENDAQGEFRAPATTSLTPVRTGATFADAVELKTGGYSDTIMTGEGLIYKVKVDWGQQAALTVQTPQVPFDVYFRARSMSPAKQVIGRVLTRTFDDEKRMTWETPATNLVNATIPQVRYLNRTSYRDRVKGGATAGFYYFTVTAANGYGQKDKGATPVPLRLFVSVQGQPGGGPTYAAAGDAATPTMTPSPGATGSGSGASGSSGTQSAESGTEGSDSASPSDSASTERLDAEQTGAGSKLPVLVLGGLGVVALLGAGTWTARRGRRTSEAGRRTS